MTESTKSQVVAESRESQNVRNVRGAEVDVSPVVSRFGGADLVAVVLGMFAALGVLVLLSALITAGAAGIEYQLNAIDLDGSLTEVAVVGTLVAIAVIFVSFVAGGWAAGRMARYDGAMNGLGSGLLFVLVVAVFGALGAWAGNEYNAFANVDLPNWFGQFTAEDITMQAIIAGTAAIAACLFGGWLGGLLGDEYHKKADAALVQATVHDAS
ncbi:MAG TPA: YrzE family protein [Acidimicrobiia bacterium]|nr:YrzE family protein [Acidimicrobiia bacterium]